MKESWGQYLTRCFSYERLGWFGFGACMATAYILEVARWRYTELFALVGMACLFAGTVASTRARRPMFVLNGEDDD